MKPAGKKSKDKKKKGGSDALAAAFAALEVQPDEEPAEGSAPLQEEDANGVAEIAEVAQVTDKGKKLNNDTEGSLDAYSRIQGRAEG